MTTHPSDPIDYDPEPLAPRTRWEMVKALLGRMVREGNQADAAERNAPHRAIEADRKARQPGNAAPVAMAEAPRCETCTHATMRKHVSRGLLALCGLDPQPAATPKAMNYVCGQYQRRPGSAP